MPQINHPAALCNIRLNKSSNRKVSFLRALREVAPEMELFLENYGQYTKFFVIKLIFIQNCTFHRLTKKMYLKEHV